AWPQEPRLGSDPGRGAERHGPERRGRPLPAAEGFPDDAVLLAAVRGRIALARARAPRTAGVAERNRLRKRLLEPVPDRPPGAHVLRLLLRPDDLLEARVRAEHLRRRLDRERIELLEARHRDVLGTLARLVPDDVVVELPGAEDESPHPLARRARVRVV